MNAENKTETTAIKSSETATANVNPSAGKRKKLLAALGLVSALAAIGYGTYY